MNLRRGSLAALALAGSGLWDAALTEAQQASTAVPASALGACSAIGAPTERLACYDQLAGRAPAPPAAPAAAVRAPAVPAAPPKQSFGLYVAEHPAAPTPAASLTARIVGLGVSANSRPTVALEGGQLWELDGPDPLLASGDSVSIKRAALGSFLMTTPNGRTHRVHRLR